MIKILLGGSPCTKWSIAQKNDRETQPNSGLGWELFLNYKIAYDKYKPDFFLYENNKSASQPIKDEIARQLNVVEPDLLTLDNGHRMTHINSARVSAQNRERFYVTNFGDIDQPKDRGILLRDILEHGVAEKEKAYCLCTDHTGTTRDYFKKHQSQVVFEPVRLGSIGSDSQAHRVYSCYGKSVTLKANGGGQGAKTGLYFVPLPDALVGLVCDKGKIYSVTDGRIETKSGTWSVNLPDGLYIIRKLTVNECKRLQTIPEWYSFPVSDQQAYKMIGNGWTIEVIKYLLSKIPNILNEEIEVLSMYDGMSCGQIALEEMGCNVVRYYATFKRFTEAYNRKCCSGKVVYVLVNFNSTMEQNLYRIYTLRDLGYDPYVMVYDKPNASKEIKDLQRWVNNRFIFRKCLKFEDYKKG